VLSGHLQLQGEFPLYNAVLAYVNNSSKSTPSSSNQRCNSSEFTHNLKPYQIHKPQALSLSTRFTHVFSTPNLRAEGSIERDRQLRRSYSATSMGLPKPSPLSPLRLPSLTNHDKDGIPWSETMGESLRLSQFPVPPRHAIPEPSKTTLAEDLNADKSDLNTEHIRMDEPNLNNNIRGLTLPARAIEIRVQQPTSITSPRPSTSVRGGFQENVLPIRDDAVEHVDDGDEEDNPRQSVHLYSMRISHHLRSGSLLSWDRLAADAPDLPTPSQISRERSVSNPSRNPSMQTQLARHERQTSSSGFASVKIPSRWGKVLPNDRDLRTDVASSIYSSRPQSPLGSFGGSAVNLSRTSSGPHDLIEPLNDLRKPGPSHDSHPDNEETTRLTPRYGVANLVAAQEVSPKTSLLTVPSPLARKKSVADTKVSKFREEFSPSPPRKRSMPSTSIMKLLNPKRLSLRSLSEANLQSEALHMTLDGPHDTLIVPTDRERRQSRSMISLQAEQEALGKSKGANHVWDQALRAHQEEKASMFLHKNKDLALHASPFRKRSGSFSSHRLSSQADVDHVAEASSTPKRYSVPIPGSHTSHDHISKWVLRRTATSGRDNISLSREIADAFNTQGDSTAVVGAWGRYPSHTRPERTLSAGKTDHVETRDFALEAAIRFASAEDNEYGDDLVDPLQRIPLPPLLPGEKRRKKRIGKGKMAKSRSMNFGRRIMMNYTAMFRSSSVEFRRHGRGHRSSIASSGTLEHPELELLPEVFMPSDTDGATSNRSLLSNKQVVPPNNEGHDDTTQGKLPTEDSMATLRPRRNSSAPNLNDLVNLHDGTDDFDRSLDRARVWSVYYETCVPSFPRLSTEADVALEDFGGLSHFSFDSKRTSTHSRTLPGRLTKHSRNGSQLSRTSRRSALSMGPDDAAGEEKSLVSVRRSTMDLISKFKEQEHTEHERVLSLTRAESRREIKT
jgi:hypothetical protein